MNCIIPFTKEVKFDTMLADIISISLEHEYNLSNNIILGNFIIGGTYKTHELSANALDFEYTLPFDLSLSNDIDDSTLKFSIDNFTYKVLENDVLEVNIDYLVKASDLLRENEVELLEDVSNSDLDHILTFDDNEKNFSENVFEDELVEVNSDISASDFTVNNFSINADIDLNMEKDLNEFKDNFKHTDLDLNMEKDLNEFKDNFKHTDVDLNSLIDSSSESDKKNNFDLSSLIDESIFNKLISSNILKKENILDREDHETPSISTESKDAILNFASENNETFVSYKIHVVLENENVESICQLYSKTENQMIEYNAGVLYETGNKVLIPLDDD